MGPGSSRETSFTASCDLILMSPWRVEDGILRGYRRGGALKLSGDIPKYLGIPTKKKTWHPPGRRSLKAAPIDSSVCQLSNAFLTTPNDLIYCNRSIGKNK